MRTGDPACRTAHPPQSVEHTSAVCGGDYRSAYGVPKQDLSIKETGIVDTENRANPPIPLFRETGERTGSALAGGAEGVSPSLLGSLSLSLAGRSFEYEEDPYDAKMRGIGVVR